ncbi:MAG: retroviral-like aspartic protease family protein [Betaproteobacteria bacterium]|nr:retroviral-like aspartic protease family protein [Betaproteobacteria bacterium]
METLRQVALAAVTVILGPLIAGWAQATTVYVMSVGYSEAQVVINGNIVRSVRIGETTPEGVRLTNIENGVAVFEVDRWLFRLGLGQSTSSQAVVRMGPDSQFRLTAYVNRVPLLAVIDTGASFVAMSSATALRLGIDYRQGRRGLSHTANGAVASYLVDLPSVQVGNIVLANVPCSVLETARISHNIEMLIGNSFLRHVHMERSGDTMVLTRGDAF